MSKLQHRLTAYTLRAYALALQGIRLSANIVYAENRGVT
jgi:hypothetical protein